MMITLLVRLSEDGPVMPVGTDGSAEHCIAWLSGFLVDGVIVDSMKVMGK